MLWHEENQSYRVEPESCDLQPDTVQVTHSSCKDELRAATQTLALSHERAQVRTPAPSGCGFSWSPGAQKMPRPFEPSISPEHGSGWPASHPRSQSPPSQKTRVQCTRICTCMFVYCSEALRALFPQYFYNPEEKGFKKVWHWAQFQKIQKRTVGTKGLN